MPDLPNIVCTLASQKGAVSLAASLQPSPAVVKGALAGKDMGEADAHGVAMSSGLSCPLLSKMHVAHNASFGRTLRSVILSSTNGWRLKAEMDLFETSLNGDQHSSTNHQHHVHHHKDDKAKETRHKFVKVAFNSKALVLPPLVSICVGMSVVCVSVYV